MEKINNVTVFEDQAVENAEEVTEVKKTGLLKKIGNKVKNVDWRTTGLKVAHAAGLITLGALGGAFALGRAYCKGNPEDSTDETDYAVDNSPVETEDSVTTE